MDERLKQRLVGALVLVFLAVIFLPMLLDGGGRLPVRDESTLVMPPKPIPIDNTLKLDQADWPAPVAEVVPDEQPVEPEPEPPASAPVADAVPAATAPAKPADKPTAAVKPAPAKTAATPAPAPIGRQADRPPLSGWAVQVGSFSARDNALALRDRLRKKKFTAFLAPATEKGKTLYRVRVGPELDRRRADRLQERLRKEMKLEGLVISHP